MKLNAYKEQSKPIKMIKDKYLIYCRKSQESEDRQVQSLPDQIKILKELANEKNLHIVKIFKESKSAKAPGRPIFNEMIEMIQSREDIKGIICWKLNRLFRNPIDEGTVRWWLLNKTIEEIITPSKTYLQVDSDFTMAVEGAQSQRFITELRENTKRGLNSKVEKGIFPALAPVGYKNNKFKEKGKKDISPDPIFFSLMRKIFDHALTGNFTLLELVSKSKDLGIKNHQNKYLSKTQMARYLRNPFYTGNFIYARKLYPGKHEAMLSETEFDLLQEILDNKSNTKLEKHQFNFTGILRCGECGMMITAEKHTKKYKNGNSQTFTYYRCTKNNQKIKCYQPYLPAKQLEEQIIDYLGNIKVSIRFIKWSIKVLNRMRKVYTTVNIDKRKAHNLELRSVQKRLSNLWKEYMSDANDDKTIISPEEFAEQKRLLKIEELNIVKKYKNQTHKTHDVVDLTTKTFDFACKAQENFREGSPEKKKMLLTALGSNLVIKNKSLELKPRKPFFIIENTIKTYNLKFEPKKIPDSSIKSGDLRSVPYAWGG